MKIPTGVITITILAGMIAFRLTPGLLAQEMAEQRGAGLGAALLGALAAALLSAELYFQGVGVRWVRLLGLMRLQPLLAAVQSLAATGKLFGVGAHALPRLGEQGVVQLQ